MKLVLAPTVELVGSVRDGSGKPDYKTAFGDQCSQPHDAGGALQFAALFRYLHTSGQ